MIELGCTYALRDLQSAPSWNGSPVTVLEYLPVQDRYLVKPAASPDDPSASQPQPPLPPTLAVRAANLGGMIGSSSNSNSPGRAPSMSMSMSMSDNMSVGSSVMSGYYDDPHSEELPRFVPGTVCALHGLNTAAFNGQRVTVIQYLEHQQRYQVRPIITATSTGEEGGPPPQQQQLPAIMAVKPMNLRLLSEVPVPPATQGAAPAATPTPVGAATNSGGGGAPPPPPRSLKKQGSKRKVFSLFRKKSKEASSPNEIAAQHATDSSVADDTDTVMTPTPSPPSSPVPPHSAPHGIAAGSTYPTSNAAVASPYPFRPPSEQPPLTFGGGGGGMHSSTPSHNSSHISGATGNANNYSHSSGSSNAGAGTGATAGGLSKREHLHRMMSQSVPNLKLDTILEGDDTRHSRDGDEATPPPYPGGGVPGQQQQQHQQVQQPPSQPFRPAMPPRMGGLARTGSVPCLSSSDNYNNSSSPSRAEPRPVRRSSLSSMSSAQTGNSAMEPRLKAGSVAKLTGLTHQSFLNDLVVVVIDYSDQHGRYRVKVRGGEPSSATASSTAVAAVNGKDLMIHRRNLLPLAVSNGSDDTSKEDSSASKAAALPLHVPYKVGDRLTVTGMALRSSLNGRKVEVLDYDAFTKTYKVRIVQDSSHEEEARGEVLNIRHENLTPPRLVDGTRVVLAQVPGKPLLDGELGLIAYFQKEKQAYRVRLLGTTALDRNNGMELLDVPLMSARAAPSSAMWVNMTLHGENLRVPLSCHVEHGSLYAKLDVFAGVDRVVPTATLLYGDDKCDWLNDEEVAAFVNEKTPFTLKCCLSSSGTATAMFQTDCPFLEPMVEYELLQATGKVNFYKLLFAVDSDDDASSKVEETATVTTSESDDPIESDDGRTSDGSSEEEDDDEDDENPFAAASPPPPPPPPPRKEAASPAKLISAEEPPVNQEPPASQEPQEETLETSMTLTDVFKPVEYELVDDDDEAEAAPTPPPSISASSKPASRPTRRPDPEEVVQVSIPRQAPQSKAAEDPPRVQRIPTDASVAKPRCARSELSQSWHSTRSREASPSQRRPDPPGRQSHEAPVEYYKHLIQQRGRELASSRVGRAPESDRHGDIPSERPRARSSSRVTKKKKKSRSSSKVRSRSRSVTRSDFSLLSIPLLPIGTR